MNRDDFNLHMIRMVVSYAESRRFLEYHHDHTKDDINGPEIDECDCFASEKFLESMNEFDRYRKDLLEEFDRLSKTS